MAGDGRLECPEVAELLGRLPERARASVAAQIAARLSPPPLTAAERRVERAERCEEEARRDALEGLRSVTGGVATKLF